MKSNVPVPESDVDHGWAWVVLFASFITQFLIFGLTWSTGIYNVVFLEVFEESKSATAWAVSLPNSVLLIVGTLSSMLINKFGCRFTIILGGIISFVGLSASFFAPNLYFLYASFGVVSGAGFGLAYIPVVTAIPFYFKNKLSFATGLSCCAIGVGNFVYPPFIRWLIILYDWRQSLLILGAISLNICICGSVVRPVRRTESQNKPREILHISALKKKSFIVVCVSNVLFCCGTSSVYIHLVAYGEREGLSPNSSTWLISVVGVSNLVGRFAYGFIALIPRLNTIILYMLSFSLTGICIMTIPLFHTFRALVTISVLFGFLSGCWGTLLTPILVQLLGLHRFATGFGCVMMFDSLGQLLGGPLAGFLFDVTDSYSLSFYTCGALCVASGVILLQPYVYVRRHYKTSENVVEKTEGNPNVSQSLLQ